MPRENYRYATQLSNRTYALLRDAQRTGGVTLKRMFSISQVTAGAAVRRGLLRWESKVDAFQLTEKGLDVLDQFRNTDISRQSIENPLSKFIRVPRGIVAAARGEE